MARPITYSELESNFFIQNNPVCPYCNIPVFPNIICAATDDDEQEVAAILNCPKCKSMYFEYYSCEDYTYYSKGVFPHAAPILDFPKDVQDKYPEFIKIYKQAAIAESMNLDQICGVGYRKAVESLVKQYAKNIYSDKASAINTETLSQTISRFTSPEIKQLATAATWLGNDHAHIISKHPQYDLNQLKSFIRFLCQHIQYENELEKARKLINNKS